jgi:hypothetical protein
VLAFVHQNRSLRDGIRYMLDWTATNGAFLLPQIPVFIARATGVDVSSIFERWQLPLAARKGHEEL